MKLTRRSVLLGSIAAGASAAGAGLWVASDDVGYVRRLLTRLWGDFAMSDTELETFVAEFRKRSPFLAGAPSYARAFVERVGLMELATVSIPSLERSAIRLERDILTSFLVWTDVVQAQAEGSEAVFIGPAACRNPFAVFDFDEA